MSNQILKLSNGTNENGGIWVPVTDDGQFDYAKRIVTKPGEDPPDLPEGCKDWINIPDDVYFQLTGKKQ